MKTKKILTLLTSLFCCGSVSALALAATSCTFDKSNFDNENNNFKNILQNIIFNKQNENYILAELINEKIELVNKNNSSSIWYRANDEIIFNKYLNSEINALDLVVNSTKIGDGNKITVSNEEESKNIFTLNIQDENNISVDTFNGQIIKNDIIFTQKLNNIFVVPTMPITQFNVKATSKYFNDIKYKFELHKLNSNLYINEINKTGKFTFPVEYSMSAKPNDIYELYAYAYSESNLNFYNQTKCQIKFGAKPVFVVNNLTEKITGNGKYPLSYENNFINIKLDKSETIKISMDANISNANGIPIDKNKIIYKWYSYNSTNDIKGQITGSVISGNNGNILTMSSNDLSSDIVKNLNSYTMNLYCTAQYDNSNIFQSKILKLEFLLNNDQIMKPNHPSSDGSNGDQNNVQSQSNFSYLINPDNENLINPSEILFEANNNEINKWYLSNNQDLTNPIEIKPKLVNNKYKLTIPSNYNGSLYIFGKDNNAYTNAINFNIKNINYDDSFAIAVKGIGMQENKFDYLKNNNSYSNYYLNNNLQYIKNSNNPIANRLLQIATKYSDLFLNFLKKIKHIDLSQSDFNDLDESVKFNLPKILNNIDNLRVKQVNFINSPDDTYSSNIGNLLPTKFTGLQIQLCSKNSNNSFNDEFEYTIAIATNINLSNNTYLSNTVNKDGIETQLFVDEAAETNFFNNSRVEENNEFKNFIKNAFMSVDYSKVPNQIPSDVLQNINNNEYCQILAYKILAFQHANNIKKSRKLYPGVDFNINNYSYEALGYINHHTLQWSNPWFMGWNKYSKILNSCSRANKNSPIFLSIPNDNGEAFGINFFDNTNFKNIPSINIQQGKNLVLSKIYGSNSSVVSQNNNISLSGCFGLFLVNQFLAPTQSQGISFIGNNWDFFGANNKSEAEQNLNKISSGLRWVADVFGLDSIDFDYEYPTADKTNMYNAYYSLLEKTKKSLSSLSIKTGKNYKLSVCVNPNYANNWSTTWQVDKYCESFNVMAYDIISCWQSNIAGGNSKARQVKDGINKLKEVISSNSNTVSLFNWITQTNDLLEKVPSYKTDVNTISNFDKTAGNGAIEYIDDLISRGLKANKIVFGLAAYTYGWQVDNDGPLINYPGAFGVRTNGSVDGNQSGLSSYINDILSGRKKMLFNPYIVDNYIWDPTNKWYYSIDFIQSILYKRQWGDKKIKGYMVWTMNCQMNTGGNFDSNNIYDFSNVINKTKVIKNLPIASTLSGLYDVQSIYNVWKDILGDEFIKYFGKIWNVV